MTTAQPEDPIETAAWEALKREPVSSTPAEPRVPTVLKFRSASGRTEIAWRSDGSVSLHVLTGSDVLTGAELIDAARALDKGQDAAYAAGIAEGLRQATEGWEREWAVRYPDGYLLQYRVDEHAARRKAEADGDDPEVVSRLVGPWEPAEQPEPGTERLCLINEGPHPRHTWSCSKTACSRHVCPGIPTEGERS